jgi:hypothetical protein
MSRSRLICGGRRDKGLRSKLEVSHVRQLFCGRSSRRFTFTFTFDAQGVNFKLMVFAEYSLAVGLSREV